MASLYLFTTVLSYSRFLFAEVIARQRVQGHAQVPSGQVDLVVLICGSMLGWNPSKQ